MLHKFDIPQEWNRLSELLEAVDLRNEIQKISFNPRDLSHPDLIEDVLIDLEAISQSLPINITFQVIHLFENNRYILLEPYFHFNKYRLITLRSTFYENNDLNFDLLKFKNLCRTKQEEAIKSGLRKDVWHDEVGQNLFGHSEEPGYFGGKGSNGWKYIALANLLIDFYVKSKKIPLYRVSPFETILKDGKLFTLNNLINNSDESYRLAIQQFMIRKLGLITV